MRNSKKNKENDLLPQRKPRLGKFILLAVVLHVVLALLIIHFYKKEPEEEPGIKVKRQKAISKPLVKEMLHAVRPESSVSAITESRPMSATISMAFEDRTPSVPLPYKRARKPIIKVKSRKVISKPLAKDVLHTVSPEISASLLTESRPMSPAISMAFEDRTPSVPLPYKQTRKPIPFYEIKSEEEPGIKVKSRKVISKPLAKDVLHTVSPEISASLLTESRPMSPAISMAFEDRTPSVLPPQKRARKPSPLPMPVLAPTAGIESETLSVRTVMAGNQKSKAEHLVPRRKMPVNARLVTPRQVKVALPSKIVGGEPMAPVLDTSSAQVRIIMFAESDKRAKAWPLAGADRADLQPADLSDRKPVNARLVTPRQVKVALPSKIVVAEPMAPVLDTSSAQVRIITFAESDKQVKVWPLERADRAEVQPAFLSERQPEFQKIPRATFPVSMPSLDTRASALQMVTKTKGLAGQSISGTVGTGTLEKTAYQNSKIVSQKEAKATLSSLEPSAWFDKNRLLKTPPTPILLAGDIAELVDRLIQPELERYAGQKVRVRVKNLTYRDKGLESEGSKFLSGLVRDEIQKLVRVEPLGPDDISKIPHIEIYGEIWEDANKVSVRLRIEDSETNRKSDTEALQINREQLPEKLALEPPEGESLGTIQRAVALMKQLFPRRGDFQLSVWPEKGFDGVYVEGERFMISIRSERDAYLHVDYYQVDGKVYHLLPYLMEDNFVKGGETFTIGKRDTRSETIIDAPFGEELLMVVASQRPIAVNLTEVEPAEPYLKRLAGKLKEKRTKGRMTVAHYIILTKARELENYRTPIGSKTE